MKLNIATLVIVAVVAVGFGLRAFTEPWAL